jgi:hypothetical protein
VTFALVLFALVLASWLAFRDRSTQGRLETSQPSEPAWRVKGYWVLPVVCFLLYLTGERSRGPIWPLCQRYMQLGALLAVPLLGMPTTPRRRRAATAAIVATGLVCIANSAWHFVLFNREVGDLPDALTQMDPNKHVAALIYWPHAKSTRFWPFLHFGSYYQAEKGGVVDFSFAGYDQWPLSFRKGRFPLYDGPATPRWEFFPRDVVSHQPLDTYFDYALVRDRGDAPIPTGFRLRWRGSRWEVFERTP